MLGLITYSLIFLTLLIGVWLRPTVGVAAVLCLFGLKQWGQSTTAFFSEHGQFTNFAIAAITLLGLIRAAFKRSCIFCRIPTTTVLVVVLYVYAFISVTWAPNSSESLDQWIAQGPYIITVAVLAPLLFSDFEDARIAFLWTALTGAAICALALAFGKWGSRGLVMYRDIYETETNPLALSSLAGTVFLIAALSLSRPSRLLMRIVATACIPIAIAVILRSGSRGQLIASGVALIFALPIGFRLRDPRSIAALLFAAVAVIGLGWWSSSIVEIDASRWESKQSKEDVTGRLANAQALLDVSSSHFSTTIFGLGNSSSFQVIGYYPHIAPLEVIAEEGFLGAVIYFAVIVLSVRSVKRIMRQPDMSDTKRNVLAILCGLFVFEFILSCKQGSLLSSVYVFAYAITLARLEATIGARAPVIEPAKVNSSAALPRFQNLMR
jgi:hypothetical protein